MIEISFLQNYKFWKPGLFDTFQYQNILFCSNELYITVYIFILLLFYWSNIYCIKLANNIWKAYMIVKPISSNIPRLILESKKRKQILKPHLGCIGNRHKLWR